MCQCKLKAETLKYRRCTGIALELPNSAHQHPHNTQACAFAQGTRTPEPVHHPAPQHIYSSPFPPPYTHAAPANAWTTGMRRVHGCMRIHPGAATPFTQAHPIKFAPSSPVQCSSSVRPPTLMLSSMSTQPSSLSSVTPSGTCTQGVGRTTLRTGPPPQRSARPGCRGRGPGGGQEGAVWGVREWAWVWVMRATKATFVSVCDVRECVWRSQHPVGLAALNPRRPLPSPAAVPHPVPVRLPAKPRSHPAASPHMRQQLPSFPPPTSHELGSSGSALHQLPSTTRMGGSSACSPRAMTDLAVPRRPHMATPPRHGSTAASSSARLISSWPTTAARG